MTSSSPSFVLRPAVEADVPALNAIHAHYVVNTVANFSLEPLSDAAALNKFHALRSEGFPYIVAADTANGTPIGFIYLSGFRGAKGGYRQTTEFSLFCHPEHQGKGAGSALLRRLLEVLRTPEEWSEEWIGEKWRGEEGRVRVLLACMALDETARKGGWGLKEYYEKFGFEQVGHLRKVGWKFGRWIDTVYLQLFL